eukprot:scaffold39949_cov67-Phaeocystis_antarctica.AAC.3
MILAERIFSQFPLPGGSPVHIFASWPILPGWGVQIFAITPGTQNTPRNTAHKHSCRYPITEIPTTRKFSRIKSSQSARGHRAVQKWARPMAP